MDRPALTPGQLRQRRLALKLRQTGLAAVLGVSHQAISGWERGIRTIPPMLDLALEALEQRAQPTHDPSDDAAQSVDRPRAALLEETEATVTLLDETLTQ